MPSGRVPPVPAVLRLVQRAVLHRWQATAEDLYREVAALVEATPQMEIVVSGCGEGETSQWLAEHTGASVTGVDSDAERIAMAEARSREPQATARVHYEQAALDDLPHETGVFDVAIGDAALSASGDPERAVAELVRVVKPMGIVVLLMPTWTSEIAREAREAIVDRLGLRPHLLVEWKRDDARCRPGGTAGAGLDRRRTRRPRERARRAASASHPPAEDAHRGPRVAPLGLARSARRRGARDVAHS